jgi:hypothetical protein
MRSRRSVVAWSSWWVELLGTGVYGTWVSAVAWKDALNALPR